ncbi:MAG TPA: hypothetical protein VLA12_22030 [Planctomycetaceae bacterium]|nr:hypothetical protein [Planctomycetaceae bacterium]
MERGGSGEPGWSGPWPALSQANFQKKTVQEGDAALHMSGTGNFARGFVRPLTGTVEIEQYIKIPPAGNLTCYVWEKNHISCGPMWRVMKGKIEALDGDERGNGKWLNTGLNAEGKEWIKVVVLIDTENKTWKFQLPESEFESGELKFRGKPQELRAINYLTETPAGMFIDALQIRRAETAKASR